MLRALGLYHLNKICHCQFKIIFILAVKRKTYQQREALTIACFSTTLNVIVTYDKKVQVGNDQEKAQSEKDSHSKNRGGEKLN